MKSGIFGTSLYIRHADNKTRSNATNNGIHTFFVYTRGLIMIIAVKGVLHEPKGDGRYDV